MSQSTPPVRGQIEAPNPLELFWEKNKRIIQFGLVAVAVAIAINYAWQYMQRRERAMRWSEFAAASALDRGYAESADSWSMYSQFFIPQNPGYLLQYLQDARIALASDLADDLERADAATLEELAQGGDARAPLARWVLAHRAVRGERWDEAEQHLQRLQREHPNHFLCTESSFPVQWRPEVETKDEEGKAVEPDERKPPELEPAQPGSAVGRMLAGIQAERAFREAQAHLYTPSEPDSDEVVTIEFGGYGPVKIRLFENAVPQHVEKFLQLARENWWQGQRVHQIRRAPEGSPAGMVGGELHFGWPSTTAEDRSEWQAGDVAEEHLVPWEDTDLSHFPGTVAVEAATEGKSQVERIVINGDDAAGQADGTRVIIGRVVEGLDVIREIVASTFEDEQSARQGQGRPQEMITITGVTVEP